MPSIFESIQTAFVNAFDVCTDDVKPDSKPDDIKGWDSLGHAVLVSELEKQLQITFDIDEVLDMEDVPSIIAIVEQKTGATN